MSIRIQAFCRCIVPTVILVALIASLDSPRPAWAGRFSSGAVGGISIEGQGVVQDRSPQTVAELRKAREEAFREVPGDLNQAAPLRKISLRRLEAAIEECRAKIMPLPDEMKYLAGIQRIQYVFVDPDQHDIILAGPGEGWKLNDRGDIVGITTGRPVLLLDDLLVALRTAEGAAQGGITCSIDPSPEGLANLQGFLKEQKTIGNPQATIEAIEEKLGPQNITLQRVPADSHFARVMVAADYRMKRLAMGFDDSPLPGMPSFLSMVPSRGLDNMMPRWWLVPSYEPLVKDPEGLAWELRGQGVRCLTEDSFLAEAGELQKTGKAHPLAQKWAETFTEKYDALSGKEPIFGELRNIIDMAVIAALIVKEDLTGKAGYSMPLLMNADKVSAEVFEAPRQVASKASFVKKGRNWIISVSGGVEISSWQPLEKTEPSETAASARKPAPAGATWWWN